MTRKLLAVSSGIEAATGLFLIVTPSLVAVLLLGAELPSIAKVVARVGGFALVALGLACWPDDREPADGKGAAFRGLLVYNTLAAIFLVYLLVHREFVGPLLWPAAVLHVAVAILLFSRLSR
jgi:hypothetical protein